MPAQITPLAPVRSARALARHPADSGDDRQVSRLELAVQRVAVAIVLNTVVLAVLACTLMVQTTVAGGGAPLVFGAVAVSTGASFLSAYRLLLQGRRDRVRAQVDRVFVKQERGRRVDRGLDMTATVFNKSSAPIWRIEVKPLRAGAPYEHDGVSQRLPDLWPDETYTWRWSVAAGDAAAEDRHPRLTFTDSSGLRWEKVGASSHLVAGPRRWLTKPRELFRVRRGLRPG